MNIDVNLGKLHTNISVMQKIAGEIKKQKAGISEVRKSLDGQEDTSLWRVEERVGRIEEKLDKSIADLASMHGVLEKIMHAYKKCEADICGTKPGQNQGRKTSRRDGKHHAGNRGEYKVDSILFDEDGSYGGNQGHMEQVYNWDVFKCWELLGWLKDYYPDMNLFKAFEYFAILNSVGCGYVGITNSILMHYEGKEAEFERTFGFPMYKDGDLNYDRLLLDLYVHNDKNHISVDKNGKPEGLNGQKTAELVESYMESKGTKGTVTFDDITPDNIRDYLRNNDAVEIAYFNGDIYNEKGQAHHIDGHGMVITGVAADGRYIVSSWGEKYYLNPADINMTGEDNEYFMIFNYS